MTKNLKFPTLLGNCRWHVNNFPGTSIQDVKVQFYVGSRAVLPCQHPVRSKVQWLKLIEGAKPEPIYEYGRAINGFTTRYSMDNTSSSSSNLVIADVQNSDAGQYQCIEDGGVGNVYSVRLVVAGMFHYLAFQAGTKTKLFN